MTSVRLDKWLWAARFFKTRTLAAKACEQGKIAVNGQTAKSSRDLRSGELLQIRTESSEYEVQIAGLSDQRGPAAVAQTLYVETEASKAERARRAEQRRLMPVIEVLHEGKPSKRDRRRLESFLERY